jgi:hypothetical protein
MSIETTTVSPQNESEHFDLLNHLIAKSDQHGVYIDGAVVTDIINEMRQDVFEVWDEAWERDDASPLTAECGRTIGILDGILAGRELKSRQYAMARQALQSTSVVQLPA